jgi:uncharacterized membrane protein YfcA
VPDEAREGETAATIAVPRRPGGSAGDASVALPKRSRTRSARLRLGTIGASGGFLSGLLGVGGGVVMVPLLVLWAGYGQRNAHAASLGAIIPISAAGVLTFGAAGEVEVGYAVTLALGAIVGAQLGARALVRAPERTLKLAFGGFLLFVAALMVVWQ